MTLLGDLLTNQTDLDTVQQLKKKAAERAVSHVKDGMVLGLGTGSTVYYAILRIAELVREGWDLRGVPTSIQTQKLALEHGVPLTDLEKDPVLDLTIDGADEVDPSLNLIKGLGGALLREKIVASASKIEIIVVDDSKMVDRLGTKCPLPVEVLPFSASTCVEHLERLGAEPRFRKRDGNTCITDEENHILDCWFPSGIGDPVSLERQINTIPGVIENGLFLGLTHRVVVASENGIREICL